MSIDKVYIFTIPRLRDRALMCHGALLGCFTPDEKIEYFEGPDYQDYTLDDLREAIAKDGYPALANLTYNQSMIAQNWAFAKMMEQIIKRDETVLYLHDDNFLTQPFWVYDSMVIDLKMEDTDFEFFALSSRVPIKGWHSFAEAHKIILKGFNTNISDQCLVLTPAFCERMFDYGYGTKLDEVYENVLRRNSVFPTDLPGYYMLPNEFSTGGFPLDVVPSDIAQSPASY